MATPLRVNGRQHVVEVDPSTPLLWVLRDHLGMTGTKFGCGIAQCGACMVHVNGSPMRSCQLPVEAVAGAEITTIEGLSLQSDHPLQKLWVEMNVPQCGYC
jgi:isoquinoline 1-oxidoreductase alpha subunit